MDYKFCTNPRVGDVISVTENGVLAPRPSSARGKIVRIENGFYYVLFEGGLGSDRPIQYSGTSVKTLYLAAPGHKPLKERIEDLAQ